jgi:hypothetical protein
MDKKSVKPKENYLKMPNHILNIKGLGKGEKMLLAHIYSFGRRGCWQSNDTLGKMFFCSPRTISMWVAKLKKGGHILWLHPKGFFRTFWAKSHPDVKAANKLMYRGKEISKVDIVSGQADPLRKNLRSECAENSEATSQKSVVPLRKKLLHTNNTTKKETIKDNSATPAPLPAGGQAPALLEDRKEDTLASIERLKKSFGSGQRRTPETTKEELEQRRLKLQKQFDQMRREEKAMRD